MNMMPYYSFKQLGFTIMYCRALAFYYCFYFSLRGGRGLRMLR